MNRFLSRLNQLSIFGAIALGMTACSPYWNAMPGYGEAVNGAIMAQAKNPDAPNGNPKSVAGLDGPAAKNSVDSYQKSFIRTPPPATGGGTLTGGSTGLSVQ